MKYIGRVALVSGFLLFAQSAQAEVIFGPRVSYYFDNSNLRTSNLTDDNELIASFDVSPEVEQFLAQTPDSSLEVEDRASSIGDQIAYPMIGAAISIGDDKDRFTLTGMFGSGSGNRTQTLITNKRLNSGAQTITDLQVIDAAIDNEIDRYDIELTWQRRLNEKLALSGGLRYERLDIDASGQLSADVSFNIDNFANATLNPTRPAQPPVSLGFSDLLLDTKIEIFSARLGATAFVPIDNSITAFFNGMLHVSHQPDYKVAASLLSLSPETVIFEEVGETSVGPDIAVGVQAGIAENISLDIRYRAIFFFPVSGDLSFNDARVNHGVNLGVSFRL